MTLYLNCLSLPAPLSLAPNRLCEVAELFCLEVKRCSLLWRNKKGINSAREGNKRKKKEWGGGGGEARSVCFHLLDMKYEEASWVNLKEKRGRGEKVWCAANRRAGPHPLGHCVPPSYSSPTPPPVSVLREHADSWLCLWWSVRGPESRREGS